MARQKKKAVKIRGDEDKDREGKRLRRWKKKIVEGSSRSAFLVRKQQGEGR